MWSCLGNAKAGGTWQLSGALRVDDKTMTMHALGVLKRRCSSIELTKATGKRKAARRSYNHCRTAETDSTPKPHRVLNLGMRTDIGAGSGIRVVVERNALASRIGLVARASSSRGAVQVLGGVMLRARDGASSSETSCGLLTANDVTIAPTRRRPASPRSSPARMRSG